MHIDIKVVIKLSESEENPIKMGVFARYCDENSIKSPCTLIVILGVRTILTSTDINYERLAAFWVSVLLLLEPAVAPDTSEPVLLRSARQCWW